jgi:hypothetical protein
MAVIEICEYSVMLDDEDVEKVMALKWHPNRVIAEKYGRTYFDCTVPYKKPDGRHSCYAVKLHRFVMGCTYKDGKVVDHIDGNTLNCQKSNLRLCTNTENVRNQKLHKNNKSGYKGVSRCKDAKKWQAYICINRKTINLGSFNCPEDAHEAYKEAALKYHGEYSRLE